MTILSLTSEEAQTRAETIAVTEYDIAVDFTGLLTGPTFASTSTIRFTATPGSATFVDCVAEVVTASLNGVPIDPDAITDGRIQLVDLLGDNTLVVSATTDNTDTSEGILRTVDPTDGLVYVWTSLECDEARRLWACFDQPDLKAPHRFTATAPESWLVTSNGAPESISEPEAGARVWTFPPTPPLSTYVVVVNAGPFHEVREQHDGYDLGFYCRQSLVPHLERDLAELVTITRQGLSFFGEKFGVAFPQERYDQVFVPNLGGAMENWGCVTYGDSQLFRTPPTHAQRALRAEFILHEMAHMWFGDLVTMRWWDDLWLNEAFASWAANWGLARATEFTDAFASFLAISKGQAYQMDMGPGSHPVRSQVPDVSMAMANFDAITYVKGQSVLHQLMAYLGEEAYVAGLQDYFAQHQWGNTVLGDLMSAFGRASGRDLSQWSAAWLDRAGPDVLSLAGNTLTAAAPDDLPPRPHRLNVASFALTDAELTPVGVTEVEMTSATAELDLPIAQLHLLNDGDLTYATVRPDAESLAAMLARGKDLTSPLARALVLQTCQQLLLLGELPPRDAARAATSLLLNERCPDLVEPTLTMGLLFAGRWAPGHEAPDLLSDFADAAAELAQLSQFRQAALQALASSASQAPHWAILDEAAASATDTDLAWRIATRRAELGEFDEHSVADLVAADPDPDANTKRLKVLAACPDPAAKDEVWSAFFVDRSVPASRETLELGALFWRPTQAELLAPYAMKYLAELPNLRGGMLSQGVVVRAMYPLGAGNSEFLAAARAAADNEQISQYARNQLRSNNFVLERTLAARAL